MRWSLLAVSLLAACVTARPRVYTGPTPPLSKQDQLLVEGEQAYLSKDYATCAARFSEAIDEHSTLVMRLGAIRCQALAGNHEEAMGMLLQLADAGFPAAAPLVDDLALEPLHADPRWDVLVRDLKLRADARLKAQNAELAAIFVADQRDRAGDISKIDWKVVKTRDRARRARVLQIVAAGDAKVADDFFTAALVFQHGQTVADYEKARELALHALELEGTHAGARWLAAASRDRALMSQGEPQHYGTQSIVVDGKEALYDIDPTVTDEERAQWHVPSLGALLLRIQRSNQR